MTVRTHDIIAFASLVTVASSFPPDELNLTTTFACVVGSVVGALVPDMDQATNRLWDLLPAGNFLGKILRGLFIQHRTLSHSILGGVIFYKILEWVVPKLLNPNYVDANLMIISLMIGFISHIAAVMVTKEGVPLFFPLPLKVGLPPFKFLRITTGKFIENFVIFPGVLVYLFWIVSERKEVFLNLLSLVKR